MTTPPIIPQACWQLPSTERETYHQHLLLQLLHWSVEHVPFYQRLGLSFDALKNKPARDILAYLPVITKEMLRGRNPDFLSTRIIPGHWAKTGGSTGEPLEIFYDRERVRWGKQSTAFARGWWGLRDGDRCFYIWGHSASLAPGWKGVKDRMIRPVKDFLRNRLRVDAYRMDAASLNSYIEKMLSFNPRMIIGYSSTVYLLAQSFIQKGLSARQLPDLKGVIVTADPCYPHQAEVIRSAFHAPVIIEYGSAEAGNIAYSHPDGTFRVLEDRIIVETIEHGRDKYEILVTDLSACYQPLIRFAMQDESISGIGLPPDEKGFCTMGMVEGRVLDYITGEGGNRLHGVALSHIVNATYPAIWRYRFTQKSLTHLAVEFQLKPGGVPDFSSENRFRSYISRELGRSIHVDIQYIQDFPSSPSGKFRWVVSELSK